MGIVLTFTQDMLRARPTARNAPVLCEPATVLGFAERRPAAGKASSAHGRGKGKGTSGTQKQK